MGRLDGKVAIISGGGKGIGKGIAERFAAEGCRVVLGQRDSDSLEDTVCAINSAGGEALGVLTDVRDRQSIQKLVHSTVSAYDRLDILVNNAAIAGQPGHFLELTDETWDDYIATNLTGAFLLARAAVREMIARETPGRIINIGSVNSFVAQANATPYVASKGGILMLTKGMAIDLARYGIAVNMIAPGPIQVERNSALHADPDTQERLKRMVPAARSGTPADCAGAALYFAGDDCTYVTGATITVDGGMIAALSF